jgi:protein-S-isoprenylcysteine O-methyltransferase Ste14
MDNIMETFLKFFLVGYYALFFLFAMFLPTYHVWKTTGVNPYKLGASDSAHDYIGRLFRVILLVCAVVILAFVFLPSVYERFLPISFLSYRSITVLGLVLMLFALGWVLVAQWNMQKSWRIGIDEEVKTELVQRGLFKISRNPIFMGMRLMLLGLFLVLPSAIMLVALVTGEILIQVQVRLEEEYLTRVHGNSYLAYQKQVRRWI